MAYADDYLHRNGYTGPGVGPLPSKYPQIRIRESVMVRSKHEASVLEAGARCPCGYEGEDIVDRHDACPACGGKEIIMADDLIELTR